MMWGMFMIYSFEDDFNLSKTADSGQCFRFNRITDNTYRTVSQNHVLTIKELGENSYELSCDKDEFESFWRNYFDLETSYKSIRKMVTNDSFLTECISRGEGIRILNQDKWEMLISFIISQRKSIPAIKTSVERLCALCGNPLSDGVYSFPDPGQILSASSRLAECGLGYRLDYIKEASEALYANPNLLNDLSSLNDDDLFEALKEFKGIGDKVASCVALFGYHRLDFFPKDVWINRALSEKYPNGYNMSLYAPFNGVMQQYIFYAYKK